MLNRACQQPTKKATLRKSPPIVVSARPISPHDATLPESVALQAKAKLQSLIDGISQIILGKEEVIRLAVTCLLARGHLLFEDQPGVGKTLLSQALAQALGLQFRRVQFTSDMLPADILGASIYDREAGSFVFHPGPVFTQVLLADEINRAPPKTQSALLEAMEEGKVTSDGITHALPQPFFVIATQNPSSQIGTFMLPESQLDRFLMRLALGVPDRVAERSILQGQDRREMLKAMPEILPWAEMQQMQASVRLMHISPALLDYVQDLLAASRATGQGLSPRGGLALLNAARAWALMQGRTMVLPEDVQDVGAAVMAHRLEGDGETALRLLEETAIP